MAKSKASNTENKQEQVPKYVVVSSFRDKSNFDKEYAIGEDVSHFDAERIAHCEQLGLIKKA